MRTRTKMRRAIKILSCDGKKLQFFAMMAIAMIMCLASTGCASQPKTSWLVYCEKYGVDPEHPTEKQENFYLDCYAGSVEEENDLCNY